MFFGNLPPWEKMRDVLFSMACVFMICGVILDAVIWALAALLCIMLCLSLDDY